MKKEIHSPTHTILIIDDDERVRSLLRDILLFGGYQVVEASDGKSGTKYIEKGGLVDMVMTDLGMPEMNGWEVVRWIKERAPKIPVALVTGWGVNLDEDKIRESGVDWIIAKPFQVHEILETVQLFVKIH
ncbi:MAG: response regulator [Thermodesulfobacteriota bacterium]